MQTFADNNKSVAAPAPQMHASKNDGHINEYDVKTPSFLFCQPKLTVGSADDPLEKEADSMADKVMRMPVPEPINRSTGKNSVQRKCAHCEEEKKQLHRKENRSESISATPAIVHDVLGSGGRSLDINTRSFMEPRFNYDFSNVRIHDGDLAAKSADAINAYAYTSGNNIVFNSGQYNTNSDSGRRLLAHELTHVMQQGAHGASTQPKLIQRAGPCKEEAPRVPHFLLINGSVHPDVREVQRKLVIFNDNEIKAGRSPLPHMPLVDDCIFGQKTFDAVVEFQKRVFPLKSDEWDGKVGNKTWAEIDKITPVVPVPIPTPVVPPVSPPPTPPTPIPLPRFLKFWINAFIPDSLPGAFKAPAGPFAGRQVFAGPPHPFHRNSCFETDERSFSNSLPVSNRLQVISEFDTSSKTLTSISGIIGGSTFEIDCTTGATKCVSPVTPSSNTLRLISPLLPSSNRFDIVMNAQANDPCVLGSPNIAIRGSISFDLSARSFKVTILSTLFPAIEMYFSAGGASPSTLFRMSPTGGVFTLFIPGVTSHSSTGTF